MADDLGKLDLGALATRVIINEYGEGVCARRAEMEYHIVPDFLFIRDDGWMLGAPEYLLWEAYTAWEDSWTHYCVRGENFARPIEVFESCILRGHEE